MRPFYVNFRWIRLFCFTVIALNASGMGCGMARAAVAFTTFGPGESYNADWYWEVYGSSSGEAVAEEFSPTITGNLASIELPVLETVGSELGGDGNIDVQIFANSPGGGSLTTSKLMSGEVVTESDLSNIVTLDYTGPTVTLDEGKTYWIALDGFDSTCFIGWNQANSVTDTLYNSTNGEASWTDSGTETAAAVEIDVAAVPEPSASVLLLVASAFLAGLRLLRRIRI